MSESPPKVIASISAVQGKLAKAGISKGQETKEGARYKYRGIDDVYAALAPLLAEHKLIILPRIVSRHLREGTSARGTLLFYTDVVAEFDFYSADDGSMVTARLCGEAMDSSDKSTNKAMSAAYKYMAIMSFAIPVEGSESDSESQSHEAVTLLPAKQPAQMEDTDLRESILQEAQRMGFPGETIWNGPMGKTTNQADLVLLLGRLKRGQMKGPAWKE